MRHSERIMVTGSIRTARITAGRAASNATAKMVNDGIATLPKSGLT
jgi:hypothetical protein